jgi:Nuclease-related domain
MLVGMMQARRSRKAGESAARIYEELTQAWLRRNRGRFLVLAAFLAPLVIGANLAAARWSSLRWSAGLVTGMVIAMFVIARMSPPHWIEKWQDGAVGEQWTGRSLRELESQGWRIFHDLDASHGNIDHVAVGPGGVFLLDSKRWRGSVTVEGDSAVVRRLEDPELQWRFSSPAHVKGLAVEVSEAIRASTRATVWVTPVIVVWGEFAQVVGGDTCKFVHGDALARWLNDQPARIAPPRVEQIAEAVAGALAGLEVTRR